MKTFGTLLKIEMKLSARGMDMMIFSIFLPVAVMVILGVIYGDSPAYAGAGHTALAQSFPAVACIGMCGGGVMGLPLVVSDYRQKKLLKRFKVTPVGPAMILSVQVAVYTAYAVASSTLVYATASLLFGYRFAGGWGLFLCAYLLVMFCLFSIGMAVGGVASGSKSAGALASILYFPMLIFSGTTLPYEVMPPALQAVADVMPMTHGIKLLKATSLGLPLDNVLSSIVILSAVAVLCSFVAIRWFRWE